MIGHILARWQAWRDGRRWVLVATHTVTFTYEEIVHSVTWMLFQRPRDGRRRFELAESARFARICAAQFDGAVRVWAAGGKMPDDAEVCYVVPPPARAHRLV